METFVSQVVVVSRPRGRGGSVFISSSSTFRFRFSCAVLGSCRSDVQGRGGGARETAECGRSRIDLSHGSHACYLCQALLGVIQVFFTRLILKTALPIGHNYYLCFQKGKLKPRWSRDLSASPEPMTRAFTSREWDLADIQPPGTCSKTHLPECQVGGRPQHLRNPFFKST